MSFLLILHATQLNRARQQPSLFNRREGGCSSEWSGNRMEKSHTDCRENRNYEVMTVVIVHFYGFQPDRWFAAISLRTFFIYNDGGQNARRFYWFPILLNQMKGSKMSCLFRQRWKNKMITSSWLLAVSSADSTDTDGKKESNSIGSPQRGRNRPPWGFGAAKQPNKTICSLDLVSRT